MHVTGVFPLPRLKLDRSPTRDSIPTAEHGITVRARRAALSSCGVGVVPLASCLASTTRVAARAPPAPGLPACDVVVGWWGSGCEEYHIVLTS